MNILKSKTEKMPDSPGIYLFYKSKELVYVGKATSLRNRVKSYLKPKNERPIEMMIDEVSDVRWIETDSVLEALILESLYIKRFKPRYNIKEKDDKSWIYLVITKDEFPKLEAVRERSLKKSDYRYVFGPYAGMRTSETLKLLHYLFNVSRCSPNQKRPCFDYELEHCLGVCTGEITSREYKEKAINPLIMFLKGKKKMVLTSLNKKMKEASKMQDFEEAGRLRNQMFSLEKIRDFSLLNKSFLSDSFEPGSNIKRIEGYDISNLGSDAKVGSMVVFDGKGPVKSEYKRFRIRTVAGQSDVDCLKEVLERRLRHPEWPLPDMILVDGGKPQVNAAKSILKKNNIKMLIIGIAKGKERKKNELFFSESNHKFASSVNGNLKLLIRVRDEAHRFAIAYQRSLSIKNLIRKA